MLTTIIPGRLGGCAVAVFVLCAAVYGTSRVQTGPDPAPDWKAMSQLIARHVEPGDMVALVGSYSIEPMFNYFIIAHYGGQWKNPVIFLTDPPSRQVRRQLAVRRRVWLIADAAQPKTARLLPGWRVGAVFGIGTRNALWLLVPPPISEMK
jgi:hypothetical protein